MVKKACNFWRKGLQHADMLEHLDYTQNDAESTSMQTGFTHVTINLAGVPEAGVVYRPGVTDAAGRRMRVRPEQKGIKLLAGTIQKFTKSGDLVFDICVGTLLGCQSMPLPSKTQKVHSDRVRRPIRS